MKQKKPEKKSASDAIQTFAEAAGRAVHDQVLKHGRAAMEELAQSAGKIARGVTGGAKRAAAPKAKPKVAKATAAKKVAAPARPVAPPPKPGAKRSPDEVAALTEKLFGVIQGHPGLNMEKIAAKMGVQTKELQLPAGRLLGLNGRGEKVSDARVCTTERKRATRYWVASAAPAPAHSNGVAHHEPAAAEHVEPAPPVG